MAKSRRDDPLGNHHGFHVAEIGQQIERDGYALVKGYSASSVHPDSGDVKP